MSIFTDQSFAALQEKLLVIHPMAKSSVTGVGYDLRVGFYAQINRMQKRLEQTSEVKDGTTARIALPPDRYLIVVSREYVFLSCRVAATFHSKSSLAAQAVFLNSTTGDPNWCGRLIFALYNASGGIVELDLDHTFTTMVVQGTERRGVKLPVDSLQVLSRYMAGFDGATNAAIFEYVNRDDELRKEFLAKTAVARRFADRPFLVVAARLAIKRIVDAVGIPASAGVLVGGSAIAIVTMNPHLLARWATKEQLELMATLVTIGGPLVGAIWWLIQRLRKGGG
jgi:deoxycytidine triphosphate deaminase